MRDQLLKPTYVQIYMSRFFWVPFASYKNIRVAVSLHQILTAWNSYVFCDYKSEWLKFPVGNYKCLSFKEIHNFCFEIIILICTFNRMEYYKWIYILDYNYESEINYI